MQKKILVIDDEELITRTFCRMLEKKGFEVMIAKRYDDALILVEENDFDLIISDIRMPGQSGVETVSQIKDMLGGAKRKVPPVIFITGFADREMEKAAEGLSCIAFLHKPFDSKDLFEAIDKGFKK